MLYYFYLEVHIHKKNRSSCKFLVILHPLGQARYHCLVQVHFMPFQTQCLVCNGAFTVRQECKMTMVFLLQLSIFWTLSVPESWWSTYIHGPNRTSFELQSDSHYQESNLLLCRDLLQSLQLNVVEVFLAFVDLKCNKKQ